MKRNNLGWAAPMAALCLLATACSNDTDNDPTAAKTRQLTINCGIGATTAKANTRAGVLPDNTDQSKESFIWHAGDEFVGWLIPQGGTGYDATPQTFLIDKDYNDNAPSKYASFGCDYFPDNGKSHKMLAIYPKGNATLGADDVFTVAVPYAQTQVGKNNTRHLAASMPMYAITTVDAGSDVPNLTFRHLTSLLRFTVTNKNASPCRIKLIRVFSDDRHPVFALNCSLKVTDWEKGIIEYTCTDGYDDQPLGLQNSPTDKNGIELSAGSATDKGNLFDAYLSVMPGTEPLAGKSLIFQITVTDGNNEHQYISMKLAGDAILAANPGSTTWEPGKRYWFDLTVDDELTVTLKEVTPMPGWDNETDL